jgi:hypothetical protein
MGGRYCCWRKHGVGGGYYEGVSRVIYCSLYVRIVFRSLIFGGSIKIQRNHDLNLSASPTNSS